MPATSAEPFAFFNEEVFNTVEAERFAPIAARQQQQKQSGLVLEQQRLLHHRTVGAVPLPSSSVGGGDSTGGAASSSSEAAQGGGCPATLGTTGAAGGWIPASQPLLDPTRHDISVHALPDAAYLEACIIPLLIPALQETARATPQDPVAFLAAYLLSNNPQRDEDAQQRQTQITQGLAATPIAGAASGSLGSPQQQLSQHLFNGLPNDTIGPQHPVLYGRLLSPSCLMNHHGQPALPLDGEGLLSSAHLRQESSLPQTSSSGVAPMDTRRHRARVMQGAIDQAVACLSGRVPASHATPPAEAITSSSSAGGGNGGASSPLQVGGAGRRTSTPPTHTSEARPRK